MRLVGLRGGSASGSFARIEEPPMLEDRVTVRHAGDVIGHGACAAGLAMRGAEPRGVRGVLLGHEPRVALERLEQRGHHPAGLGGHALHLVVLVDAIAQEALERLVELLRLLAEADERRRERPHIRGRGYARGTQARCGSVYEVADQVIDHAPQDLVDQPPSGECRVLAAHHLVIPGEERNLCELLHRHEAGANAVVDVVIVIGNLVREISELRLESRLRAPQKPLAQLPELPRIRGGAMFQDPLAALEGEVEAVEFGVLLLQLIDDPERLQVVLEAAEIAHALVQRILARVPERRVAEIVRQTDRLRQHLVQGERPGDGTRDLRNLQRMREAGAIQVAFVIDEHLSLVDQPAEGGGVDDAVAVTLVFRPIGGSSLGMTPAARLALLRCVGGQDAHAKCSCKVASSALLSYFESTVALPSRSSSTRRTAPASTFLSIFMSSSARATPIRGASTGSPARRTSV